MSKKTIRIEQPAMTRADITRLVVEYPEDDYKALADAFRNAFDVDVMLVPFALAHLQAIEDEDDDAATMFDDFVVEQFSKPWPEGKQRWDKAVASADRYEFMQDLAWQIDRNGPVAYLLALAHVIDDSGVSEVGNRPAGAVLAELDDAARWAIRRFHEDRG